MVMIQGALRQMLCNKIMSITFINQVSGTARIPKAVLLDLFKRTEKLYKKKIREKSISVIFVSENESKKLNSKYRNKAYATNVLSFESFSNDELGDIIICPAVARKQAKDMDVGFVWWLSFLFTHGLLHLIGFDHKTKKQEIKMDDLTKKIICE